jgi:hypothetical protein
VQALSLAKECYTTKMDMLTNVTVVDDAVKFLSKNSQHIQNSKNKKNKIIMADDDDIEKEVLNGKVTSNTSMIDGEDKEKEEEEYQEVANEIF